MWNRKNKYTAVYRKIVIYRIPLKRLGSPYGGAVTAYAVTERALLSPLRGHLSQRERQGRLRRQLCKFQFVDLLF